MILRYDIQTHGYGGYSNGCRCGTCKAAKAAYMRAHREPRRRVRRLVQDRQGGGRNYVDGITHGYAGYQDYSCRCDVCRAARAEAYQRAKVTS